MNKNFLLSVGCDNYDSCNQLSGAGNDAKLILDTLVGANYARERSVLLLSPRLEDFRSALRKAVEQYLPIDVFTFYFAGHGCESNGNYYLGFKDLKPDLVSMTCYPLSDLFNAIKEIRPVELNIVIDSCFSGGSHKDLAGLTSDRKIGTSEASSVNLLAASSANEEARETEGHGVLTSELVKYLSGELVLDSRKPYLDLIELGKRISSAESLQKLGQRPTCWGINLFGLSRFANNPHFSAGELRFSIDSVSPLSQLGVAVNSYSDEFLRLRRECKNAFRPEVYFGVVESFLQTNKLDDPDLRRFIVGMISTLGSSYPDESRCVCLLETIDATLAILLSEYTSYDSELCGYLLVEREDCLSEFFDYLDSDIDYSRIAFDTDNFFSNLVYRPFRLSKIIAWISLEGLKVIDLGEEGNITLNRIDRLLENIVDANLTSLAIVDERQATFLYMFFQYCFLRGANELAEKVFGCVFSSYEAVKGKVLRGAASGSEAFKYCRAIAGNVSFDEISGLANVDSILPVLLWYSDLFNLNSTIEGYLRRFDRATLSYFLPEDYEDFGSEVISRGRNFTLKMGFDLHAVPEFTEGRRIAVEEHLSDVFAGTDEELRYVASLASVARPNRICYLYEGIEVTS